LGSILNRCIDWTLARASALGRCGLALGLCGRCDLGIGLCGRCGLGIGLCGLCGLGIGLCGRCGLGIGLCGLGIGLCGRCGLGIGITLGLCSRCRLDFVLMTIYQRCGRWIVYAKLHVKGLNQSVDIFPIVHKRVCCIRQIYSMLPRIQRSSCELPLTMHPHVQWAVADRDMAARLAAHVLGTTSGLTRCVISHFARTRRAHSLNEFAEQLVQLLTQPLCVELTSTSLRLHSHWEVPFIALTRHEIQIIAILAARENTFAERTRFMIRQFAYNDVMQQSLDYNRGIECVIAFVATLTCGYLAAPLAALCAAHKDGRWCV
jgi:hypothetical protein